MMEAFIRANGQITIAYDEDDTTEVRWSREVDTGSPTADWAMFEVAGNADEIVMALVGDSVRIERTGYGQVLNIPRSAIPTLAAVLDEMYRSEG